MKKMIIAGILSAAIATPVIASTNSEMTDASMIFNIGAQPTLQLQELTKQEMKTTEGSFSPFFNHIHNRNFGARLSLIGGNIGFGHTIEANSSGINHGAGVAVSFALGAPGTRYYSSIGTSFNISGSIGF
jgi:hypothetical protein